MLRQVHRMTPLQHFAPPFRVLLHLHDNSLRLDLLSLSLSFFALLLLCLLFTHINKRNKVKFQTKKIL